MPAPPPPPAAGALLPRSFHDALARSRVLNAGYADDAAKLVAALPTDHQRVLRENLDALSSQSSLPAALQQLAQQIAQLPVDMNARRSGEAPGASAMRYAGAVVIHSLLAKLAEPIAQAGDAAAGAALIRAARAAAGVGDRERSLWADELRAVLGRALYVSALEIARGK